MLIYYFLNSIERSSFYMKTFCLYWSDGEEETICGESISDAFTKAGYGVGAIRALDYYKELTDEEVKEILKSKNRMSNDE